MKSSSPGFSRSFALISVLALVSLAALSATAFLASARLERLASRPLADVTRLEMASSTGLAMAMSVLVQAGDANTYKLQRVITYWRTNEADDLGYLLVGTPVSPLMMVYLPAFSTASMSNALDPTNLTTHAIDVTGQGNFRTVISNRFASQWTNGLGGTNSTNFPLLGNQTSPPVAWIPIRQERRIRPGSAATTNVQVARMAFYVQDLQGLVDAERMGGSDNRTTGTNPAEISLINLSGTALIDATKASNFAATTNRPLYASVGMLVQSNGGGLATNDLRYVATGLRSWGWMSNNADSFSNRIPPGIQVDTGRAYTNAGQEKFDLNTNLTAASVGNLVTLLSNNLPNFTNRAGGMAGPTYLSNIAANIVDLFDADNFATTSGNTVRGIDSYPFVNEIWDRFELRNVTVNTANHPTSWTLDFQLEITTWMELWNLSSQDVTNGTLRIIYRNREVMTNLIGGTHIPVTFTQRLNYYTNVDLNFTADTNSASLTNCRIPANSFHMVPFPPYVLNVSTNLTNVPVSTPLTATNLVLFWATNGNANGYATYFATNADTLPANFLPNPARVDASSSSFNGIQRNTNSTNTSYLSISQPVWWRGNATPNSDLSLGLVGDPRIMFNLSAVAGQTWWDHQFDAQRASWWARNTMGAGADRYTVDLNRWPEYAHNTASFPNINNPATDPASITRNQETNKPLQIIYNQPSTNIFQIGRVFDPVQWSYNVTNHSAGIPITGASPNASSGGGHTLRIGRPEHPRFAFTNFGGDPVPNLGMSAAAMLDLFRVGSADSNSFTGGGKINLNTAPAPVLAALAGGVSLTNDPSRVGSPANSNMTNAFALGVLKFRQLYPFYSPSQLSFISTDYGTGAWTNSWSNTAVFGTNQSSVSTNGLAGVTALNDEGREEWFSRIYGLSGVDSLNFRCYVVAQLTDTNGNPRGAPSRKYYQIYNVPYPQTPAFSAVVVEEGSY